MADKGVPTFSMDIQRVREMVGEVVLNHLLNDRVLRDDPDYAAHMVVTGWITDAYNALALQDMTKVLGRNIFGWQATSLEIAYPGEDRPLSADSLPDDDIPF